MSFMNVSSITSGTLQANMIADIHEGSRRITEENKTNGKLPKDGITLKKNKGQIITGNAKERLRHTMQVQKSKKMVYEKLIDHNHDPDSIQWDVQVRIGIYIFVPKIEY